MKVTKTINKFLYSWNSFWVALLIIYIGIMLTDAFKGGQDFKEHWLIILFVVFPLFLIGTWAINKNKIKGEIK